jgi:hypothetical protein
MPNPFFSKLKSSYPLWVTLVLYWLFTLALFGNGLGMTGGKFIYPLDDTYIHMAIGKHLVQDGAWSVTGGAAFTSTTSSPLWTFLVALSYWIFGVNEWTPLALNFLFGTLTIVLCYSLLYKKIKPLHLTVYLLLAVLFTPLPILTLAGMEHTLHGFLTLWLVFSAAAYLSSPKTTSRQLVLLAVLSALVSTVRYEGLFLVAVICFLLLLSRRISSALVLGAAGLLPVAAYGLFSLSQGWDFLPTSLILKGNTLTLSAAGIASFFSRLPTNLLIASHVLLLLVAAVLALMWLEERKPAAKMEKNLLLIFLAATLLHMQFASTGWFYRYESYLILASCIILIHALGASLPARPIQPGKRSAASAILALLLGILLLFPLAWRTGKAFQDYPFASMNIYHQHYQMGLFLKTYYNGKSVGANDIGAINYLADIQVLDLYGLGTVEVARAKQSGGYGQAMIADLVQSRQVEVLILYNVTFAGQIPPQWVEVGQWQISDETVVGSDTISFYAPSPAQQDELIAHLRDFSSQLPQGITESGLYTK